MLLHKTVNSRFCLQAVYTNNFFLTKFSDVYTNHNEKTYVNYIIMTHIYKARHNR